MWYADAMRLWKRAPFTFCALGFLALASEFALQLIPDAGMLASKIIVPIITCGLYVSAHSLATGGRARITDALRPFAASAPAIAAIVVASLAVFVAQASTAYVASGADLFTASASGAGMDFTAVLLMFAVGMLVSLPFTMVALCALLDDDGFAASFTASFAAFNRNVPAFLFYGVLSYALLLIGIATLGVGLVIVLPLWATSSYAAWRDILHAAQAGAGTNPPN